MLSGRLLILVLVGNLLQGALPCLSATKDHLEEEFRREVRPFLETNCLGCHDAESQKGDLDLERYTAWTNSWNEPEIWTRVVDQVSLGEMPPPDKKQPGAEARGKFLGWAERFLNAAAEARAGDPGPALLRRLNNAEYGYTVRDLTGVASLDPAREFPADSAAGEGFMNTGSALVMSPELFAKYFEAAKKISEHAVLVPDGFRFSEKTTRRDWAEEILGSIRSIYARYSTAEGGEKVDLQGIVFNTNEGGRLPLTSYLEATLAERDRLKEGAFAEVARERKLSAKYLRILWGELNGSEPSLVFGKIRTRWVGASAGEAATIAGEIGEWQKAIWKFSSVGHIGKLGGPKAWLEPVNPLEGMKEGQGVETNSAVRAQIRELLEGKAGEGLGEERMRQLEEELDALRALFPAALCYTKIVPVDEVVTLTLAHREDDHLKRLMLDKREAEELDRLWDGYEYVSQNALLQVDAFEQLWQYATQDADPKVFEPMREPIARRAEAFRERLVETETRQVEAVIEFAARAYRRALRAEESAELRKLYGKLRAAELGHEEAFRQILARVFVAPAFLYRLERDPESDGAAPVTDDELATRLSYFLWSSTPDAELLELAAENRLGEEEVLMAQTARMLRDERAERLSREFAAAWLHLYDFESLDEKSAAHFPEFAELRGAMQAEVEEFFTDLFQNDGSVLAIFDGNHTFLNEALAKHYGIGGVTGSEMRRVEGVKRYGRGGILTMAATLSKQSGASRTSPILRGNWISEVIVGEKLPKPPKGVPPLPEDAAAETLTMRELVQKHTSDPRCANCHSRIDGYGFAMEGYDAIGRWRTTDAGKPVATNSILHDGTEVEGLEELRDYLITERREAVVQQFCRKLVGYALGRAVMLSDRPLVAAMQQSLAGNDYRFSSAVETLVRSKQFRQIRGKNSSASGPLVSLKAQEKITEE
jgi:rubrerythrin